MSSALSPPGTQASKAFFMVDDTFFDTFSPDPPPTDRLTCHLNPTSVTISGGGEWKHVPSSQDREPQAAQFTRRKPRTMKLELLVDRFEADGDVAADLAALEDWTRPRPSLDGKQASAPWLRFQWGSRRHFRCFISSYQVTYTLFSTAGVPLRATVNLTLKEAIEPQGGTNPTSGGIGGERTHVVGAGDTLHSIAFRHYGRPRLWRGLATFNDIDDPLRLATGDAVELPEIDRVEELS